MTQTAGILQVTLNASGGQSRTRIINADTGNAFPWLTFTDGEPITVLDVFENEPEVHPATPGRRIVTKCDTSRPVLPCRKSAVEP